MIQFQQLGALCTCRHVSIGINEQHVADEFPVYVGFGCVVHKRGDHKETSPGLVAFLHEILDVIGLQKAQGHAAGQKK